MPNAVAKLIDDVKERGGLKGMDVANIAAVSPATVSRWSAGKAFPHPKTQLLISDLRYVVDRLAEFYTPEEARLWLYAKHRLLDGERAIDLIHAGRADAVLDVIESLDAATYTDRIHDQVLLDALDALAPEAFAGDVWRVTRAGRDPLVGSTAMGRWSPPDAEVLYTSLMREGALAEIGYRLSLEPIWPSKLRHELHRFAVRTGRTLRFADVADLAPLGVDVARYHSFDYVATQAIAAAARFLDYDGLLVPSARTACTNLVLFLDRATDDGGLDRLETEPVDWDAWRRAR